MSSLTRAWARPTGPCPWERLWDEKHSREYYYLKSEKKTSWVVPPEWKAHFDSLPRLPQQQKQRQQREQAQKQKKDDPGAEPRWAKAWDARRSRHYYWRKWPDGRTDSVLKRPDGYESPAGEAASTLAGGSPIATTKAKTKPAASAVSAPLAAVPAPSPGAAAARSPAGAAALSPAGADASSPSMFPPRSPASPAAAASVGRSPAATAAARSPSPAAQGVGSPVSPLPLSPSSLTSPAFYSGPSPAYGPSSPPYEPSADVTAAVASGSPACAPSSPAYAPSARAPTVGGAAVDEGAGGGDWRGFPRSPVNDAPLDSPPYDAGRQRGEEAAEVPPPSGKAAATTAAAAAAASALLKASPTSDFRASLERVVSPEGELVAAAVAGGAGASAIPALGSAAAAAALPAAASGAMAAGARTVPAKAAGRRTGKAMPPPMTIEEIETAMREPDAIVEPRSVALTDALLKQRLAALQLPTRPPADAPEAQRAQWRADTARRRKESRTESTRRALDGFTDGYIGCAQNALQACEWLNWAVGGVATGGAPTPEERAREHIRRLVKRHFDVRRCDEILDSGNVTFMEEIAKQGPYWRRLLLELYDEHPESILLKGMLTYISQAGHRDEIAAVVSEGDVFGVFDEVLRDKFAQVPPANLVEMGRLLPALKRLCCSGVYTFLYTQEVLHSLEKLALAMIRHTGVSDDNCDGCSGDAAGGGGGGSGNGAAAAASTSGGIDVAATGAGKGKRTGTKRPADDLDGAGALACWRKFRRLRQELAAHAGGYWTGEGSGDGSAGLAEHGSNGGGGSSGGGCSSIGGGGPRILGAHVVHLYTEQHKWANVVPCEGVVHFVDSLLKASDDICGDRGGAGGRGRPLALDGVGRLSTLYRLDALLPVFDADVGNGYGGSGYGGGGYGLSAADAVGEWTSRAAAGHGKVRAAVAAAVAAAAAAAEAAERTAVQLNLGPRPPVEHIRHPALVDLLVRAVFHPGIGRSADAGVVRRCCILLAFASTVGGASVGGNGRGNNGGGLNDGKGCGGDGDDDETVDLAEVAWTALALYGTAYMCTEGKLLQQRELQGRLARAMEEPAASHGVLSWARALLRPAEGFTATANYPTFAPLLLRLCGRAAEAHPPQRPAVLATLRAMVAVNMGDNVSSGPLKKQAMAGVVGLVLLGYVVEVFRYMTGAVRNKDVDPPLIRHFFSLLFDAAPPFRPGLNSLSAASPAALRASGRAESANTGASGGGDASGYGDGSGGGYRMAGYSPVYLEAIWELLAEERCVQALTSLYFGGQDRKYMVMFLGVCETAVRKEPSYMSPAACTAMARLRKEVDNQATADRG